MRKILNRKFYNRPTLAVARELLGKLIVREAGGKRLVGRIVETEAYNGPEDLASHASRGRTARTEVMFGQAGLAYIYFIYGMYHCFNIITEEEGYPAAVLIRAVEPIEGMEVMAKNRNLKPPLPPLLRGAGRGLPSLIKGVKGDFGLTNGPGKFCQAFQLDKGLNGHDLTQGRKLWLEDRPVSPSACRGGGETIKKAAVVAAKRIGVDYAGAYKDKHWRFYLKGNEWVSKK